MRRRTFRPFSGRPIIYHFLTVGRAYVKLGSGQREELQAGDIVIFPHGDEHFLELVMARLSELLFVETLRLCVNGLPSDQSGWLAGTRDPVVGEALALLHREVAHPSTVATLAQRAGLHARGWRSVFGTIPGAADGVPDEVAIAAGRRKAAVIGKKRGGNCQRGWVRLGSGV